MSSTFYGLEIARTGLYASQSALNLTGHNISNANTVGYTRQRLIQTSAALGVGTVKLADLAHGTSGAGTTILGIEQVRDIFLDRQYRAENAQYQYWDTRSDALSYVEGLLDETGDSGLSTAISDFFDSLQSLSRDPESKEYRTNVQQTAQNMVDTFQQIASQLTDKAAEMNDAINTTVTQINDIARNIADLNVQIARFELNGESANDLRDQRNVLLDKLSGLANITSSEDASGHLTVQLAGEDLVVHDAVRTLTATQNVTNPFTGASDYYSVTWTDNGTAVNATTGSLRSYQDLRDGDSASNQGIPYYMHQLDTLAATMAHEFNAIHAAGYTLPDASNGNTSVNGVNFFDETGTVTAANFSLSAEVLASVYNIAASDQEITDDTLRGNYQNALNLYKLETTDISGFGTINSYYNSVITSMGLEISHTNQMRDAEATLTDSIDTQRTSVSGVSMDEEMTNLIKYQHAYTSAARVITTIDEALDTIISKMGVVGR